ncbi:hypothetical protein BAE44_0012989, partial [Dichanthelium oligosanthes]
LRGCTRAELRWCFQCNNFVRGWGFVIRDNSGDVISAGNRRPDNILDAFQEESWACMHATKNASDQGMVTIMVESDSISEASTDYVCL